MKPTLCGLFVFLGVVVAFVRVRGAAESDPLHEFDVAEAELRARPGLYEVVDEAPVVSPRPPRYVSGPVVVADEFDRVDEDDSGEEL